MYIRLTGLVLLGGVAAGGLQLGRYAVDQIRERKDAARAMTGQEEPGANLPMPGPATPADILPEAPLNLDEGLFPLRGGPPLPEAPAEEAPAEPPPPNIPLRLGPVGPSAPAAP